jgi:hypothetical protein
MTQRNSRASWIIPGVAVLLLGTSAVAGAHGKDPFVGSWQYDAAHSSFTGIPAYASAKVMVSAQKKDVKVVSDATLADGKTVHYEYAGPTDGSDVAVTGNASFSSVTLLRPDAHTVIRTDRRAGRVVGILTVTVDKDGKSMTGVSRGVTADNHTYTTNIVFTRVK